MLSFWARLKGTSMILVNLLALTLKGAGFKVVDLGVDVSHERFVEAIIRYKPRVVGISALLTVTMVRMAETINVIKKQDCGTRFS